MLNDTPTPNHSVQALNKLRTDILALNAQGLTWRQIGQRYCISHGMAYRIATQPGYVPASLEVRQRLGLMSYCWADLPDTIVRWALAHREELPNA